MVLQLVEECKHIDILPPDVAEREDAPQSFRKEIERELHQLFPMCCELLGKDLVGFSQRNALDGGFSLSEDIFQVVQHQEFLGDAVAMVLVDEYSQCCHDHLDAGGGPEQEGFVADEVDVGRTLAETLDELLRHHVCADKDGYLAEVEASSL